MSQDPDEEKEQASEALRAASFRENSICKGPEAEMYLATQGGQAGRGGISEEDWLAARPEGYSLTQGFKGRGGIWIVLSEMESFR